MALTPKEKKTTLKEIDKGTVISQLCEQIAEGKSLRSFCRDNGFKIGTVLLWIGTNAEYAEHYARARDAQGDAFAEDIQDLVTSVTPETASADRIKIDALKWLASKRAPKKYGEKIQQEVSGPNGTPIELSINFVKPE